MTTITVVSARGDFPFPLLPLHLFIGILEGRAIPLTHVLIHFFVYQYGHVGIYFILLSGYPSLGYIWVLRLSPRWPREMLCVDSGVLPACPRQFRAISYCLATIRCSWFIPCVPGPALETAIA